MRPDALGHRQAMRLELFRDIDRAESFTDDVLGGEYLLGELSSVVEGFLAAGDVAIGAADAGAGAIAEMHRLLQFLARSF